MTHFQYFIAVIICAVACGQLATYVMPVGRIRNNVVLVIGVVALLALLHRVSLSAPRGGILGAASVSRRMAVS